VKALKLLRAQMEHYGITQKEIAERLCVGKWHVSHVLAGRELSASVIRVARKLVALEAKRVAS
jgi:hypothetical protein